MNNKTIKKSIRLILFFIISLTLFAEKEKITWITVDSPPFYINSEQYKDTGIGDKIIDLLRKNMSEYSHEIVRNIPVTRMEEMIAKGENVCFVTTFKNAEREKIMYFTKATVINPSHAIVTLKTKADKIGEGNSVSLTALLQNKKLRLGIADRVYGKTIDTILANYKEEGNIYKRSGSNIFTGLLDMLRNNRIDYIIGLPYEIKYVSETTADKAKITSFEINEMKNERYMYAYAAFPKNSWGAKMVAEVNTILDREQAKKEYFEIFSYWLDEKSVERAYIEWEKKLLEEKQK